MGPSRGAVPEAGDSGERCRGAAPSSVRGARGREEGRSLGGGVCPGFHAVSCALALQEQERIRLERVKEGFQNLPSAALSAGMQVMAARGRGAKFWAAFAPSRFLGIQG